MSNRTVNLKDVAAKAGVSITTVSHVINKTRFVKPETTAAVESAIKELNYVHNLAAKTLRSKKSGIIGVMTVSYTHLDVYKRQVRKEQNEYPK